MTTLFDSVVTEDDVWRGAARFLYAPSGTSFPSRLESVIQPSTPADPDASAYALGSGWVDFGGTTEDGVTINREFEGVDGIPVDQLASDLFEGDPTKWKMGVNGNLLETDAPNLIIAWELPSSVSLPGNEGPDYRVAQTKLLFSTPTGLTERLLAVVQQHPSTSKLRVAVFRKAKLTPESREMVFKASEGTSIPVGFNCSADTSVDNDEDPFGALYEED